MSRFDLFFVLVDECNEVTDYAIARRIVDLHSRQEESVEREYTLVRNNWIKLFFSKNIPWKLPEKIEQLGEM